jgi:hypothetical protein
LMLSYTIKILSKMVKKPDFVVDVICFFQIPCRPKQPAKLSFEYRSGQLVDRSLAKVGISYALEQAETLSVSVCERAGEQGPIDFISPDDPFLWQKVIATERAARNSYTHTRPRWCAIFHIAILACCIFRSAPHKRVHGQKKLPVVVCVGCTQLRGCCCCVLGVVDTTQPGALSCWATTRPYLYKKMRAAKDTPCFVYHLHRGHRHSSSSAGAQAVPLCRRRRGATAAAPRSLHANCQRRELIDAPEIALLACEGGFACGKTPCAQTR